MTLQVQPKITLRHMSSRLVKLALPVAIQSSLVAILALADVLMVSDFGKEATAAVGIASKWHFVAIMIMAGLSTANGTLVSQYWGKKDSTTAKTVTLQTIRIGIWILIPVTVIITILSPLIMLLQTSDETVISLGSDYLWYSFPVLILTHIIIVIESSMRSTNDAMTPFFMAAITVVLNISLNFWLIKGGLGVEPMGVAGAALATTISRFVQVVIMLSYIQINQHWLMTSKVISDREKIRLSFNKLAVPTTTNALVWAIGTLTYQMIFGQMGTTELAVFSMLGPFESLCYSVFFGIAVACSVLTGQSLGREDFLDAIRMSRLFIKLVFCIGVFLGVGLFISRQWLVVWLNLDNAEFYPLALPAISILCTVIWLRMLNLIIINGVLRAGGDSNFCLKMDFIAMWIVGIPITAYGAIIAELNFTYVYFLLVSEEVVKFLLCFHRYMKLKWVNNLTLTNS
ncbi:MATE family efflux transporter [Vibrio sp. TH_r3]|uniref:MATE family efflux transporter n=1 Tax=Vibrio sp. TH_r3 TaxID=3082084 RepID=UPI0029555B3D|nr:MATE family efflux transporter [Vibrio sp. TH_r3]MDV7105124.1 MATE family efflux transporter [Vibrio sp. TH_r3]